jgi:hypothetical protein
MQLTKVQYKKRLFFSPIYTTIAFSKIQPTHLLKFSPQNSPQQRLTFFAAF